MRAFLRKTTTAALIALTAISAIAADNYISCATGNFTAPTTWARVDTTSFANTEAQNHPVSTSWQGSFNFSPVAATVDGHALKFPSTNTATDSFYTHLYDSTAADSVAFTDVVCNSSELSTGGWFFFKYPSAATLVGGRNYQVRVRRSTAVGTMSLYRTTGAFDWCRMLRTTTNAAPGATDNWYVAGEITGPGTGNSFTVTMDNTGSTVFGSNGTSLESFGILKYGTLSWGTAAATNYKLVLGGVMRLRDGTLSIGTTAAPIPATSTAEIIFNCAAAGDYGLNTYGGNLNIQGSPKRSWTLLAADAAIGATALTCDSTWNWAATDSVAFAPTSTTYTDSEVRMISSVVSDTQFTITAPLTYAHTGTEPLRGAVGNLTRNIKIHGSTLANSSYIEITGSTQTDVDNCEFYWMGTSTTSKLGISASTAATGRTDFSGCSLHDTIVNSYGFTINAATVANYRLNDSCTFNTHTHAFRNNATTTATSLYVTNNMFCGNLTTSGSGLVFMISDMGGTFSGNDVSGGGGGGMYYSDGSGVIGPFSGNTFHSNGSYGLDILASGEAAISGCKFYRNTSGGARVSNSFNLTFLNCDFLGNNIGLNLAYQASRTAISNCMFNGETGYASGRGLNLGSGVAGQMPVCTDVWVDSCAFSRAAGYRTAMTLSDVAVVLDGLYQVRCVDTLMAGSTEVGGQSAMQTGSYVASQRHDQTAGLYRVYTGQGTWDVDATIKDTGSTSLRMTPVTATGYLKSYYGVEGRNMMMGRYLCAVKAGRTSAVSVKVRESSAAAGDSATYNGQHPRLWLEKNPTAGISASYALDTATAASLGAWQTLSGVTPPALEDTVLTFYVDCGDGGYSAGWVNVDSFTASPKDTKGFQCWSFGVPAVFGDNRGTKSSSSAGE